MSKNYSNQIEGTNGATVQPEDWRPVVGRPETHRRPLSQSQRLRRTLGVTALLAGAAVAGHNQIADAADTVKDGFHRVVDTDDVSPIDLNGPHREVEISDTEGRSTVWQIAQEAAPDENTGEMSDAITAALEEKGIEDVGTLQNGDIVPLPLDAEIGQVVDPSEPKQ